LGQHVAAGLAGLLLAAASLAGAPAALVGAALAGGDDAEWRQPVRLEGFAAVELVVRGEPEASPPAAALLLEDGAGNAVYRFPPLPGTGEVAFFRTQDAGIADVDRDGLDDVVIVVEAMTGIGPSGAEPFPLAGVYLRRGEGFVRSVALEEALNSDPAYGRWNDLPSLLDHLASTPSLAP
jgi:hypothetical protein